MDLEKIVAHLRADISHFVGGMKTAVGVGQKSMNAIKSATGEARTGLNKLGRQVLSLKGALASIGVGLVAKQFVDAAVSIEQMQIQLKTLLGSTSEANKLFDQLATVAGALPFELEDINGAAVRLSTAFGKDRDQIVGMTKAAANVAAIFGEKVGGVAGAADQIARAFTAGTGAADRFRDAGVTAMLGISGGASVSGEEFKKKFLEVFGATSGKFKNAANEMSNTWTGTLSMIADKWFLLRKMVMEAGVFDYLKAIAKVIDESFGSALKNTGNKASQWADTIISGIEYVIKAVGFLKTAWQGISIIWEGLKLGFEGFKLLMLEGVDAIVSGINKVRSVFGQEPIDLGAIQLWKEDTLKSIQEIKDNFGGIIPDTSGLQEADMWIDRIREKAAMIREEREKAAAAPPLVSAPTEAPAPMRTEDQQKALQDRYDALQQSLMSESELQMQHNEEQKEINRQAFEEGLITQEDYYNNVRALATDHQEKMMDINKKAADAEDALNEKKWKGGLSSANSFFGSMMSLTQNRSKALFQISKAGAIATAVIETYKAAQSAFSAMAGIPVVGPALGAAAAAAAIASGIARVNAIKSTSFGGGGGAGGAGGGGGPAGGGAFGGAGAPTTAQPEFTRQGGGGGARVHINLGDEDGIVSKRTVRALLEGINEQLKDGATLEGVTVD